MQPKTIVPLVASSSVMSLTGFFIFLLSTPPLSFVLFFLFFLLTAALVLTLLGKKFAIRIPLRANTVGLQFLLVLASVAFLTLQAANVYVEAMYAILYVVVFILAPGISILNMLKFRPSFSRIEFVGLAYPISVAFLAIAGTILLLVPSGLRGASLSFTIAILSMISLCVTKRKNRAETLNTSKLVLTNTEVILTIVIFIFVSFFMTLYPEIANLPELDISRAFLQASAFTKEPLGDFHRISHLYPLFPAYESSTVHVIGPSVEMFQSVTILLNIFIIVSFYGMASQYLHKYGSHIPAIATLFWSVFAGLGWTNFLGQKIVNPDASLLSLIVQADAFSYGDITWRRLFFHLSMECSLALVFAVLYLLKRKDMSRKKNILLTTILITPLPLMHIYGTILLFSTLVCFAIISSREIEQQLTCVGYSLTAVSFAGLSLNYILNIKAAVPIAFLTLSAYLPTGLVIITVVTLRGRYSPKSSTIFDKLSKAKNTRILTTLLLLLCLSAFLLWCNGFHFDFRSLNIFGYVPWALYSVKLGVVGILGILAISIIFSDQKYQSRELVALLASALLMIFGSRLLSAIQMHYSSEFIFNFWLFDAIRKTVLSFREERMFELFKVPLAIVSSLTLVSIVRKTKGKSQDVSSQLAVVGLISLTLIAGMSSTLLGFQYQQIRKENLPSSEELEIISTLRNRVFENSKAIVISPKTPSSYLDFTGATAIVTESNAAWSSKWPELPMFVARYTTSTPSYIYLHKMRDEEQLSEYAGNYLEHLLGIAPSYLENSEVNVRRISSWSSPISRSTTALILPYDKTTKIYRPFNIEQYKNNTVLRLSNQENMYSTNIYPEPIGYNNVEITTVAFFNGLNSHIRVDGTDINFDKLFIELEFQPLNLTRNQVLISKFDWGVPPQKSFEIAQYGDRLAFKLSPDGGTEVVLATNSLLAVNKWYNTRFEYDGTSMKIFINNQIVASKKYLGGIFKSDVDIVVGAELCNDEPRACVNMKMKHVHILNDIPTIGEPVFYAYDTLCSANFNYTTTLSNDPQIANYETIILPYDDQKTLEIMTKINEDSDRKTQNFIILNTNGYGPLLEIYQNTSSGYFTANGIIAHDHLQISPLQVPVIHTATYVDVKASYTNGSMSSPFIMATKQEDCNLIYVNLYPFIQQDKIDGEKIGECLSSILNNFVEMHNTSTISQWFTEPSLLFKTLEAIGTIKITTTSTAFLSIGEDSSLIIQGESGSSTFKNVRNLTVTGYETVHVEASRISIQEALSFYTKINAIDPRITLESDKNAYVTLDNTSIQTQTSSLTIKGNVAFLARQPIISIDGSLRFQNFYMVHPSVIHTDGRDMNLLGNVTLNLYVSDEFSIAIPYSLNSPIMARYKPALTQFKEIDSLLAVIPAFIVALIVFTVATLLTNIKEVSIGNVRQEGEWKTGKEQSHL